MRWDGTIGMKWDGTVSISLVFRFGANGDGSVSGGSLIGLSLSLEIEGMASSHIYGVVDLARVGSSFSSPRLSL